MSTIRLYSGSGEYDGYHSDITFYPYSGGSPTIIATNALIPYFWTTDYYYGVIEFNFTGIGVLCSLNITEPTPTPTPTSTPTSTPTPTSTSTPTPTPTATSTPTPTPTATIAPEGAVLDILVPSGTPSIVFDGQTFTSNVAYGLVKNQQYTISVDDSSGNFLYWSGTGINLPAPSTSFTVVYVTGSTATLQAIFAQPTPTPTPTASPTSTPTPTPTAQPSGLIVTISEVGSDVIMSGSGSLNLTGLVEGSVQAGWGINGTLGTWAIGPSSSFFGRKYQGNAFSTYPTSFGSGYTAPTSFTGDAFGIQNGSLGKDIIVPIGYTSGSPLSGTVTFANKTISSMGLTPGIYLYNWGSDSITLQIGS